MTSDQVTATADSQAAPPPSIYDWSNIATIRRSISRNRSNAGDRYPKYGDPIRYTASGSKSPSRAGSTETMATMKIGLNGTGGGGGVLYPHLEERPLAHHNLRSTKSEYFLATSPRSAYLGVPQNYHHNIDDDTKWITSSSSTASYHSAGSSSREPDDETDDDRAQLYAEVGKPVSIVSLPPLDRGTATAAYQRQRFASSGRMDAGSGSGTIYQQTNGYVGDNNAQSANDLMTAVRGSETPPPPPMATSHMNMIGAQQPRKYFTLNPPRHHQQQQQPQYQRSYQPFNHQRRVHNHDDDLRRRSMTPMTTTNHLMSSGGVVGGHHDQQQSSLNRSQSCYVDPLDYKVGCQNTLRSKPLIPWYELAIKDSNRRSCPQFEEVVIMNMKRG